MSQSCGIDVVIAESVDQSGTVEMNCLGFEPGFVFAKLVLYQLKGPAW